MCIKEKRPGAFTRPPKLMKKQLLILLITVGLFGCEKSDDPKNDPVPKPVVKFGLNVPDYFPPLAYDTAANPISEAGFKLGRALFYDPRLSRDNTISCGSCHIQNSAFTQHGHDLSHGIDDKLTMRNSLPIQNLAWQKEFFWDGGVGHLDFFAISPIEAENEMDETVANVLEKLRNDPVYLRRFKEAFGTEEVTTERFLKALAQFQLMCISADSEYDRYLRGEGALPEQARKGLALFEENCAGCHSGALQSDFSYRNNGLPVGNTNDTGRHRITQNPADKYKFRVPSLRNVAYSFPYMHDGRFRTLEEVLQHYAEGVVSSETLDPQLEQGIALSGEEQQQIIAYLRSLSDLNFLSNPELSEFAQ